jgi:GNAT superfamily N-acetyltransferase
MAKLELTEPTSAIYRTILDGIRAFNATMMPHERPGQDLAIALHDPAGDAVVGGLWGRTAGGWLAIELVYVPESLRGQGIATRLVAMAEREALERGCHSAWLDTLNREALRLYERLGYRRFGELKDYPRGGSRYFLQKQLTGSAA